MTETARREEADEVDVLLVCTSGGHLLQLWSLAETWPDLQRGWVTNDRVDARSLLRDEKVWFAHFPTNRNLKNLLRNALLARRLLEQLKPRVIVSTGAAVAIPFAWLAKLRGIPFVYVESFARVSTPSMTCRLVHRAADRVYVQWPDVQRHVRGARYVGSVFSGS